MIFSTVAALSPEELDTQVPDKQCGVAFQLFASLLRFGSGWFANHALRTRHGVAGVKPRGATPLYGVAIIASRAQSEQQSRCTASRLLGR